MRILLRHFFLAILPLAFGLGAAWGFAFSQPSCGHLVGPVFGPKCRWIQLEYEIKFMMAGTALGCLLTVIIGTTLEFRRRRAALRAPGGSGETLPST